MHPLQCPWTEIEAYLKQHVPAFKAGLVKVAKDEKARFFKIQYDPGEVIMPKGVYSEYVGVHLTGHVFVYDRVPKKKAAASRPCWQRPGPVRRFFRRRVPELMQMLVQGIGQRVGLVKKEAHKSAKAATSQRKPDHDSLPAGEFDNVQSWGMPADDNFIKRPHAQGHELPFFERLMGVTGALLNQPRSYTLAAGFGQGRDEPCEFYLVPRRIVAEIRKHSPEFHSQHLRRFLMDELPRILAENRLFRNTLYPSDILDPSEFVARLKGDRGASDLSRRLWLGLNDAGRRWLEALSAENVADADLAQLVSELNTLLKRADLFGKSQAQAPAGHDSSKPTENQIIKANRVRLEQAYPEMIRQTDPALLLPTDLDDLKALIQEVGADRFQPVVYPDPERPEDKELYAQGKDADGLYVIVSGQVQIDRPAPGLDEPMLLNRLSRHGFFGLSCLEAGAKHSASARAVSEAHLLKLDGSVVRDKLQNSARFPGIAKKLREERARMQARDAQVGSGRRLPPAAPPQDVATRLMVTLDILRIDMDLCTRCDQCMAACAASHDGIPRFRRANPDLRFGKWEVAKACVHCEDAPCQRVCPVGAITFLENGPVEILRNRCIGCEYCVLACPFDVIEMAVATPGEPLCVSATKPIATKCDLCSDKDHDPPCVVSCPYGAAQRGHVRDLFPASKSWADTVYAR